MILSVDCISPKWTARCTCSAEVRVLLGWKEEALLGMPAVATSAADKFLLVLRSNQRAY